MIVITEIPRRSVASNAEAAACFEDSGVAAVAGDSGESVWFVDFDSNIEDSPGNKTRFLVIGQKTEHLEDKTTILVAVGINQVLYTRC